MKTQSRSLYPRRHGFTLVEMLVVIAIIVLLVSLVTPAITSALDRAKTIGCLSNMRQVSTAILQYAGDQGGEVPRFQRSTTKGNSYNSVWAGDLIVGGYLDAPLVEEAGDIRPQSILRCPAGLTDQNWNGELPGDPWTENPNVHRPWPAAQDTDDGRRFVHIWYGMNARTEHDGSSWPFIRSPNQSVKTTILRYGNLERLVMFYDGVWSHNSSNERIYARHGTPRSRTNFAFFDGSAASIKTRVFNVGSNEPDIYPQFRYTRN